MKRSFKSISKDHQAKKFQTYDQNEGLDSWLSNFFSRLKRNRLEGTTGLEASWLLIGWLLQALMATRPHSQLVDHLVRSVQQLEVMSGIAFALSVLLLCGPLIAYVYQKAEVTSTGEIPAFEFENYRQNSRLLSTYLETWKFLVLLVEPLLTGQAISVIIHIFTADNSHQNLFVVALASIPQMILAWMAAVAYSFCIESRLPYPLFTSTSNRFFALGLTFSTRLAFALDTWGDQSSASTSQTRYFNLAKISVKLILMYWIVFKTSFYNKRFMLAVTLGEVVTTLLLLTNLVEFSRTPLAFMTIVGALIFKLIHQSNTQKVLALTNRKKNLSFEDTIIVCWTLLNSKDLDPSQDSDQILRLSAIVYSTKAKKKLSLASLTSDLHLAHEKSALGQSLKMKHLFLHLFENLLAANPTASFEVSLFELFFLLHVDPKDLFLVSILLGRLKNPSNGFMKKQELEEIGWLVEANLKLDHNSSVFLTRLQTVDDPLHFVEKKVIDLEEPYVDQHHTLNQGSADLFRCLLSMTIYDKFTRMLQKVIRDVLFLYDKMQISLTVNVLHATVADIARGKRECFLMFSKIDSIIGQHQISHLLPYIVFLDIVDNNREMCRRLIKSFRKRLNQHKRSRQIASGSIISVDHNIDISEKICLTSLCSRTDLGKITYISRNFDHVMDCSSDSIAGSTISSLLPSSYQSAHSKCMLNFYSGGSGNYFNSSKMRILTFGSHVEYKKMITTSKICPSLPHQEILTITSMVRTLNFEDFMLADETGRIIGLGENNQYLFNKDFILKKTVRDISENLAKRLAQISTDHNLKAAYDSNLEFKKIESIKLTDDSGLETQNRSEVFEFEFKDSRLTSDLFFLETINSRIILNWLPSDSNRIGHVWFEVYFLHPDHKELGKGFVKRMMQPFRLGSQHSMDAPHARKSSKGKSLLMRSNESDKENNKLLARLEDSIKKEQQQGIGEGSSITFGAKSSIESAPVKVLLKTAIRRQNKSFVRKELVVVLLIQLAVWGMCTFLAFNIDQFFGVELINIIKLRSGFHFMIMTYTNLFNIGIFNVDLELNYRGLGKGAKKYEVISRRDIQSPETNYGNAYRRGTTAANALRSHIYSFEYEYAYRYLAMTVNYTSRLDNSNSQPSSSSNITIVQNQQLALYVGRYWNNNYKRSSLDSYHVQEFLDLMGDIWLKVGIQTMIYTVDLDNQQFEKKLSSINTTIVVTICLSFFLAYLFIFFMYLIISKIRSLYTVFSVLYEDEIQEMKAQLSGSLDLLEKCSLGQINDAENFNEVFMAVKSHERKDRGFISDHKHEAKRATRKNKKIKKGPLLTRCLGMTLVMLAISALMQSFGTTALITLQRQANRASRLLVLMGMHRVLGTTNATMNFINFRTYILALKTAGKGFGLSTLQHFKDEFKSVLKRYLKFEADLEAFLYENQGNLKDDNSGFELFFEEKPCTFFDKTRNFTSQECAALANGEMGRRIINVYRWQRITILNLDADLDALTPANALDIIYSRSFLELEYLRIYFSLPFFVNFSSQFYGKILDSQMKVTKATRSIIFSMLIVAVLLTVLLNVWGYLSLERQLFVSLQAFLLLPSSSYIKNPYIVAKISSLKR